MTPNDLYRQRMALSSLCCRMTDQGIKIDPVYANDVTKNFSSYRALLFPYVKQGRKHVYAHFKPTRKEEILTYFRNAKIRLDSTSRQDVEVAWIALSDEGGWTEETEEDSMPDPARALRRLYWYKNFNHNVLNFFHPRWLDRQNYIHPRWHCIGNAVGSVSCSRPPLPPPSYMGRLVRRAVVPFPGHEHLTLATLDLDRLTFGREVGAAERLLLLGTGLSFLSEHEVDHKLKKEKHDLFHIFYDWKVLGRTACLNSAPLAVRLMGRRTDKARKEALRRVVPLLEEGSPARVWLFDLLIDLVTDCVQWDSHYMRLHGNTLEDRLQAAASFQYRVMRNQCVVDALLRARATPVLVDGNRIIYSGIVPEGLDTTVVKLDHIERWG